MIYEIGGTLESYDSKPYFKSHNIGSGSLAKSIKWIKDNLWEKGVERPEACALEFYAMNNLASILHRHYHKWEVLQSSDELMLSKYLDVMDRVGKRVYAYMLLIITREARHLHTSTAMWDYFPHGAGMKKFIKSIRELDEMSAVKKLLDSPPNETISNYIRAIEYVFMHGGWSTSYGGPKWGGVAKTLGDFVDGKTSMEMMVDTAFTLAHNTGPIFNKGMLFHCQNNQKLAMILDVQRSGQIPEFITGNTTCHYASDVSSAVISSINYMKERFEGEIEELVDWDKVEELGALHKYPGEKKKQYQITGDPNEGYMKGKQFVKKVFVWEGVEVSAFKRVA